jgi:NAD(P)-dependent dehydrogenase (short-subunit alcohol dehydrogenase family)
MQASRLFDLSGKVALVTGGSRGLGFQMAEALGEMGAKLAISARKQSKQADTAPDSSFSREMRVCCVATKLRRP